ncbi:MAG: DUF4007 family protein [Lewinellaceae bacterium]|nr:DUF4007 family protein [Lewinellaceae bacterium]
METLYFTGHDTFHCRNFWLKKGLDLLWNGGKFDEEAMVELGVGKNMVNGEQLAEEKSKGYLRKNRAVASFDKEIWAFLQLSKTEI